jgi:hypothetical protein
MNDHERIESYPQTIPPCPSWCGLQPVHEYDSVDHNGALIRSHERIVAESFGVSVAMVQSETAAPCTAPDVASCAGCAPVDPELHVEADGVPLTGSQARQLAGWLLIAAGEWEEARS